MRKHGTNEFNGRKIANNHMHSDSIKRRSSYLVALLYTAGDVERQHTKLTFMKYQTIIQDKNEIRKSLNIF